MLRTQIQLTEKQSVKLKALAAQEGTSVAQLIRQGIDLYLQSHQVVSPEERKRRAIAAAGKFRSGLGDLSTNHDQYLAEAFSE